MAFQVTEVQKALKGVSYPSTGEQLADHAKGNGGDDELVERLREIGSEELDGPDKVMAALKGDLGGPTDGDDG